MGLHRDHHAVLPYQHDPYGSIYSSVFPPNYVNLSSWYVTLRKVSLVGLPGEARIHSRQSSSTPANFAPGTGVLCLTGFIQQIILPGRQISVVQF